MVDTTPCRTAEHLARECVGRRAVLGVIGAAALSSCVPAAPGGGASAPATGGAAPPASVGTVLLDVVDASGSRLTWKALRELQSAGAGEDGYDDMLLDSDTLQAVLGAPLYEVDGASAALDLPAGGPWALSLSWPTSHGYSALLADLPGPGRYCLAELAARSLHERQPARQETLPAEADRQAVEVLRTATTSALEACKASTDPLARAVHGAEALEAAATAQLALDEACVALAPEDAVIGVTFTEPPSGEQVTQTAQVGAGTRRAAARIVVADPEDAEELDAWAATIDQLHEVGSLAMVQVCDSAVMAALDDDAWDAQVATLLSALPAADAWEIGNELGGTWLGDGVVGKVRRAGQAVRANPATAGATTVVTLYYQLGQDAVDSSLLTWARANLTPELLAVTDVVGLSVYPQWHPLGTGADRVLSALAACAPGRRLALTELGYGAEDLDDGPWWFGSAQDRSAARSATARHLTSVALGRDGSWGAPFWWYYLQDHQPSAPGEPVGEVLAEVAGDLS